MRYAVHTLARSSTYVFAALALAAGTARAQSWPADDEWLVVLVDGMPIVDATGDRNAHRDIVGDAAAPAAFVASDADFVYFRIRIDSDPFQSPSNYRSFAWGVEIDTDGMLAGYELLAMIDGLASPDEVLLQENSSPAPQLDVRDPAETVLATYTTGSHSRVVDAASSFGGDPDFFVDWAIDVADLVAAGVDLALPLRFIFGSSNDKRTLSTDLAATSTSSAVEMLWSDPIRCDAGSCDACSTLCGTDCLRCADPTSACDGTICVECASGDDCPAVRPLCDRATSTCVGGSPCAGDVDCVDPRYPACQPDGSCAECSRSNDSHCEGATPLCDVSAGECAPQCTADADCASARRPACGLDGRCAECSETQASACDPSTEACNPGAGTCAERCGGGDTCESTARPICKNDSVCVQCLRDDDCSGDTPVCDGVTGTCVRASDLPPGEEDAGLADAGPDGPAADAGPDAEPSRPTGTGASFAGGGCGCRLAADSYGGGSALALAALLTLAVLVRNRSRRARTR